LKKAPIIAVALTGASGMSYEVRRVDFIVARVLDQLGIAHDLMPRWGENRQRSHER
jgi:3-polyprenyl-4-hydroxybenzoate decarboxylase